HLGRLRGLPVIAPRDVRGAGEDLAVLGDPDLDARVRQAHRAKPEAIRAITSEDRAGLGQTVALQDADPEGIEELRDLRGERGPAREADAQAPAERGLDLPVHQALREGVLQADARADRAARLGGAADPATDRNRPVEEPPA